MAEWDRNTFYSELWKWDQEVTWGRTVPGYTGKITTEHVTKGGKKRFEHAYWNVFNIWYKSLCWQRQNTYCVEKLVRCSGVILAHSLWKNGLKSHFFFYELWVLVLSIDVHLDWGQLIGWVIPGALFSYSETNGEFPWLCLGSSTLILSSSFWLQNFADFSSFSSKPWSSHLHW